MEAPQVAPILQQALFTTLSVAGPLLLASLLVGLTVSILQAATQVNEATLTFVPKLLVISGVLLVMGPGMTQHLIDFTRLVFVAVGEVGR